GTRDRISSIPAPAKTHLLALNEQKAGPFPLHRSESTDPRPRCQIDQRFAQCFSRRHTLQKWQAERGVALRKINAFRIDTGRSPRTIVGAEELGRLKWARVAMVRVHRRKRPRLSIDQSLRIRDVGHEVIGL